LKTDKRKGKTMAKTWVIIKDAKTGTIKAWRDYGDHAWGAATYEVLDYFTGSHKDALKYGKRLKG